MSKVQYRESKLLWSYNYLHLKSGFQFSLDQLRSCSEKIFHFHEDNSFRCCAINFFCLQGIPFTSWWRLSYFIFFSLSIFWNSGLWIWNFVVLFFCIFCWLYWFEYLNICAICYFNWKLGKYKFIFSPCFDFKRFIHTQIILEIFAKVLTAVFGFGAKIQTQYDIVLNLN